MSNMKIQIDVLPVQFQILKHLQTSELAFFLLSLHKGGTLPTLRSLYISNSYRRNSISCQMNNCIYAF